MIRINDDITLDDRYVRERFVRAIGPGGRNLSTEARAVELRLNVNALPLPLEVKHRLRALAGRHVTTRGVLIVVSRVHRSQEKNREAARARLAALLNRAATPPAERRPTRAGAAEREQRLVEKKRRGATKALRRGLPASSRP